VLAMERKDVGVSDREESLDALEERAIPNSGLRPQALDGSVILRIAELSWVVEGILNEEIMEG